MNVEYLVPELKESAWELEYVEIGSDEQPEKRGEVWLIESYHFTHGQEDITLYCNLEAQKESRNYEVNVQVKDEDPLILNFRSRLDWWTGIKQVLKDKDNRVNQVIEA
jgi:hypothetical protein